MNGKISLLLVLGFSAIFGLFGRNMLSTSNVTVDNYSFYFERTQANQIARSGVYLALGKLNSSDPNWTTGYSNKSFSQGRLDVTVALPSGVNGPRIITSIGTFPAVNGIKDTVITTLRQRTFSEYGNYYNKFAVSSGGSVWAATGDVFDGRFHANDFVRCYGDPEFKGQVTSSKGVKLYDANSHPIFHVTPEVAPAEAPIIDTAGMRTAAFGGGKVFYDTTGAKRFTDVYLKFYANGTVDYKSKIGSGSWSTVQNKPITDLSSNGLLYVQGGRVSVEGVLNGQVTVAATKGGCTDANAGKVLIPNSITYSTDPLADYNKFNPPYSCSDLLGIVGEKEVIIPFNNSRGDINIHASIFSQDGGMKIESYGSYSGVNNMNIVGGIIGNYVEPTANYVWNSTLKKYVPVKGYSYVHSYDRRFDNWAPPYFPKRKLFVPELWYTGNVKIPVWG